MCWVRDKESSLKTEDMLMHWLGYGTTVEWWSAGENRGNWDRSCYSANTSTTNLTWTHGGLNQRLQNEKPAREWLNSTVILMKIHGYLISQALSHEKHFVLRLEIKSTLRNKMQTYRLTYTGHFFKEPFCYIQQNTLFILIILMSLLDKHMGCEVA